MEQQIAENADKILYLFFKLATVGFVILYTKDFATRMVNYVKVKWSDFGRGTKVEVDSHIGHIEHINWLTSEIEISIKTGTTMFIPIDKFLKYVYPHR